MKYRLIFIFLCLMGFGLSAQNPQKIIDYADRLYDRGEYFGALKFYHSAMEIDSSDTYLLYQLGQTYKQLNQLEKAVFYLEKVSKLDWEGGYPLVDFHLAETYFKLGNHRYADRYYRKALRPYRRDEQSEWYKRITQRMNALDFAKSQNKDSNAVKVSELQGINTFDSEFSPMMMGDTTLLFASLRADSLSNNNRIKDVDYYSRIYKSVRTENSSWTEPTLLPEVINLNTWDVANPAYDKQNSILYFSKCDSLANCEIWKSKYINGAFAAAEKMGSNINLSGSNNTQAFPANINGTEYLFFVSDRAGGFGQLDIWYSTRNTSGQFAEAVNAGSVINSIDNEITPYYSTVERKLYFSSTWHLGYGGYDIFQSKGTPGDFSKVENMGQDVNSSYNDYYFNLGDSNLFFVSDRREEQNNCCCNNIYSAAYQIRKTVETSPIAKKEDIISVEKNTIGIPEKVSVDIINQYLPVELYFHNDYPNPNSWDTTTTANYSNLLKDYTSLEDEYIQNLSNHFSTENQENATNRIRNFFDKKVKEGFDKLEFFMPMLIKELEKGNHIKMTIKGYASSISGSEYNLNLTLRRIESLINYLEEYNKGELLPYINGPAENGGQLSFVKLPFGDYVNTDSEELTGNMKIYSPQAARNRKIEILAITESKDGVKSLDGSEMEKTAKLSLNSTSYKLNLKAGANVSPTFLVKNKGDATLKIYAVDVNCECAEVEFDKNIKPGEEGRISVSIDTKGLIGKKEIKLLVISNSVPNIQHLSIELLIQP